VTCDRVVRYAGPAPGSLLDVTDNELAYRRFKAEFTDTRGTVDMERGWAAVKMTAQASGYDIADLPKLFWGGELTDVRRYSGVATVVSAPRVGGGWYSDLSVDVRGSVPGLLGVGASTVTATDPANPATLTVLPLIGLDQEPPAGLLVFAPQGAGSVRATNARHDMASSGTSGDGPVVVPLSNLDGVTVDALDAGGRVIATWKPGAVPPGKREIDNWG
jgi:hypothetical protein